jgi:hypothetical protein
MPRKDTGGGATQPRTLDDVMRKVHMAVVAAGGMDKIIEGNLLNEITMIAKRNLEPEHARMVELYYHTMANSAEPIARAVVERDENKVKEAMEKYNQGRDMNGKFFGISLAQCMARWVGMCAAKEPDKLTTFVTRAVNLGATVLSDAEWSLFTDKMVEEIWRRVPSTRAPMDSRWHRDMQVMGRVGGMTDAAMKAIAGCSLKNDLVSDTKHSLLIEPLAPQSSQATKDANAFNGILQNRRAA